MSGEDLKRRASTPSTNPTKMHFEVQDIFGGDEVMHHAADELLLQGYKGILDIFATKCRMLSNSELMVPIEFVISKVPAIPWPGNDVILRELDNATGFRDSIVECLEMRNYRGIRNLVASLRKDIVTEDFTQEQSQTAVREWERPYVGDAHRCLYEVIESSGAGKSRMVDELSKERLLIPINLRPENESGFPAADHDVREFFDKGTSRGEVYTRYTAFFTVLFQQLLTSFLVIKNVNTKNSIAFQFRLLMTQNQTYDAPNCYRRKFYQHVCQEAERLYQSGEEINLHATASAVVHLLAPPKANQMLGALSPVMILAFDGAHQLTKVQGDAENSWSRFGELKRNIRNLRSLPIFSLFISTLSKISDFTPAPKLDMSARIVNETLPLLPPFTELGFDQLLKVSPIKENTIKIQDAAMDHFMCRFGRPLFGTRFEVQNENIVEFAASKLICGEFGNMQVELDDDQKLACMAVRLALDFNSTTLKSQQRERLQVAKHMRICIKVNDDFETIVSVAPSEPILAEGARRVMSDPGFNLPASLLRELQTPGLDGGPQGELVCLVLLLLACDKAAAATATRAFSVHEFFKNLLNDDHYKELLKAEPSRRGNVKSEGEQTFQKTFADSKIYFNHFIKIHDPRVVNREYLWMLIARGAAVLYPNNQVGIDAVVPFTYYDAVLGRKNVSAILIQVKNNRKFSTIPIRCLFDGMNPFFVGLFDHSDEPLPVIRMVFALASAKSGVAILEPMYRGKTKQQKAKRSPPYTSYDIWCAGVFAETFAVIDKAEEGVYEQLLKACKPFPQLYKGLPEEEALRRSLNPGSMVDGDHWGGFEDDEQDIDEEMDEYDFDDVEEEED